VPKKIPVSESSSPLVSNPFGGLEMQGLPEGPAESQNEKPRARPEKSRARIVLRREKSQRGGKTVVVVGDIPTHLSVIEIENLARRAKQACGCGGTVAGREIELQGDDPARVRRFFEAEGFRVAGV
jgi:translation initiation factor 1